MTWFRTRSARWAGVGLALLVLWTAGSAAKRGILKSEAVAMSPAAETENPFSRRIPLPAGVFDGGVAWLNTAGPMPITKLRGKIVLLDFWTFCCINCIHVLPDLEKLEKEFPNELVVVGVHSAKFDGEKDSDNIRSAIMRYGIHHPVINDANHAIWDSLGINSWPTLLLIDPQGEAVRSYSGEGKYEIVRADVLKLIAYHKQKGTLDGTPLHIQTESAAVAPTPLRFPGKVVAEPATNRIAVADSSHNRLVLADLDSGKVRAVIGAGTPGLKDGGFRDAQFNDPQGMAFAGDKLYVADRKNHALRLVDFTAQTVVTLAGNGKRGGYSRGPGSIRELASPWDLLLVDGTLYIAMAGTHQIWSMNVADPNSIAPFAGDGAENIQDGSRANSSFAQPSGLATDGQWLYVADSETSSVRALSLKEDLVQRLVGLGLFEFGDVDGSLSKARLQHALGVAVLNNIVYVADTYNNKLKTIDRANNAVRTFLGDRKSGAGDDPARFNEPGGIFAAGGKLYVADTNNHAIRVVDPVSGATSTLTFQGLEPPVQTENDELPPNAVTITAAQPLKISATGPYVFHGLAPVPKGAKLNSAAPMTFKVWKLDAGETATRIASGKIARLSPNFEVNLARLDLQGAAALRLSVTYFTCEEGSEGVCRIATQAWRLPILVDPAGETKLALPDR